MREIKAILRPDRLDDVIRALHAIVDLPGATVSIVQGFGKRTIAGQELPPEFGQTLMAKLEIVVPSERVGPVVEAIRRVAHTGRAGDGKIFVVPVEHAVNIRSGIEGPGAL